jgi:pyruvate/2-oxoglutarate/acetoin dehydrogenase E1 component
MQCLATNACTYHVWYCWYVPSALQVEREGTDVTIVTFSKMVGHSLQAAEALKKEGVSVEVINLRTLRPLDYGTVLNSVKKTSRLVTVEEGWPQNGIGADISANVTEQVSTLYATDITYNVTYRCITDISKLAACMCIPPLVIILCRAC